jgi:Carbohydrate binding module (family 6)
MSIPRLRLILPLALAALPLRAELPAGYAGRPFADAMHQTGPANIPGLVSCALFDLGGEGIAYHDTTPENEGSGVLNRQTAPYNHQRAHAGEYIWHFRADEAVDVSYVKDWADLNHTKNTVVPPINQFYLGWTSDGEWVNYTVNVREPGTYAVKCLYSLSAEHVTRDAAGRAVTPLRFDVNGRPAADIELPRATAGWHAWDYGRIATVTFAEPGLHLLTFHYRRGNNWAFFIFERLDQP